MNISELEAVSAVAMYGSFGDAAAALQTPLSTLSKRVARLENELGVALFERKTAAMSVSLTEQGAVLMPGIRSLLTANSAMLSAVSDMLGKNASTLVMGSPPLLGNIGESGLIADFLAENPDIELVSVMRSHSELMRLLSEGRLECAFFLVVGNAASKRGMWEMFKTDRYSLGVLRETDEMYIGLASDDPLTAKSSVNIKELRDHTFIFNKWHDGLGVSYGRDLSFFESLGENKSDYRIMFEDFVNTDYIYRLLSLGGCALPQSFPDKYDVPGIKFLPLEGWKQKTSVVFMARKHNAGALRLFTDYLKKHSDAVWQEDIPSEQ